MAFKFVIGMALLLFSLLILFALPDSLISMIPFSRDILFGIWLFIFAIVFFIGLENKD